MATSGTHTFSLDRDEVITHAFRLINVYDINSTVDSADLEHGKDYLNMLLLHWSGQDIRMWKRKIGYLFPAVGTTSYSLGPSGSNATGTYVTTDLSVAAASGASTLTVDSTTGMTTGDYIGVELDDGTRQWTTVTVNSSTGLSLGTTLTDDAAIDNTVITYTTKLPRPLRIIRGTTKNIETNTETTLQVLPFDDYFDMPSKTTAGVPNNIYYDKTLTNGVLYCFPTPNTVNDIITFTYLEEVEDAGDSTDDIDIPRAWQLATVFGLAVLLAYAYQEFTQLDKLEMRATQLFETIKYYDTDDEPMVVSVKQ
jgi:hypothetical protein